MNKILITLLIAVLAFGCRKELCRLPHPHPQPVVISVDWSATYDGQVPAMVGVHFFPMTKSKVTGEYTFTDNKSPITFYLPAPGGQVDLPVGVYAAVAYNLDTERIILNGHNQYESLEAFTERITRSTYTPQDGEQLTVDMPDYLYTDNLNFVEVVPEERGESVQTIHFAPTPAVIRFFVYVKVDGLQYATNFRGAVSNMRGSYLIGANAPSDLPVTLFYNFDKANEEYIGAEVYTFGALTPCEVVRHTVTVDFLMNDGAILSFPYDVSEKMVDLHHGKKILIGSATLPPTEGGGGEEGDGGFDGDIGNWEDEIIAPIL